jgi:lathosterol oxidase
MEFLVVTAELTAIIAARYLLVAAAMYVLLWRRSEPRLAARRLGLQKPARAVVRHELTASLVASPIYALPAAVALVAWKHAQGLMYVDAHRYGLWWLPVSAAIYLLVQDTYYYWVHRALHDRRLFAWAHRGHHLSREPTPFAAFAFDATEAAATAWVLPALTFLVPLNVFVALALLTLMTASAVLNHCGFELLPQRLVRGPVGAWLISATHHSRHHTHMRCNYGLYLRAWDRWMGTDAMPEATAPSPAPRAATAPKTA